MNKHYTRDHHENNCKSQFVDNAVNATMEDTKSYTLCEDKSEHTYEFLGIHFLANYTGCQKLTLTNIAKLKSTLELAIKASGATILNDTDHVFESSDRPELPGYTCAFILSESHATIHTYPEFNSCFVDLFTCGLNCSHEKFAEVLNDYLQPKAISCQIIKRETDMKTLETRDTGLA